VTILAITSFVLGLTGIAGGVFGVRCYIELRRWARQCQRAEIAIAYNRRVRLRAPLVEWLTWANQLEKDEKSTGRVVYRANKMSVAILRPDAQPAKTNTTTIRPRNGKGKVLAA